LSVGQDIHESLNFRFDFVLSPKYTARLC
jgi:hypothetical protein